MSHASYEIPTRNEISSKLHHRLLYINVYNRKSKSTKPLHAVGQLVGALLYSQKVAVTIPDGVIVHIILPAALWPWVRLSL